MLCLLESQDLVSFVDGGRILPLDIDEQKLWRRTDRLIQGWILGSIGEDALDAVWDKPTARDVWVELENSFSRKVVAQPVADIQINREEYKRHIAIYEAALRGDWDTATKLFPDIIDLTKTIITSSSETALHIAVQSGKANGFVKKLVERMPSNEMAIMDTDKNTALHNAASFGNAEAVSVLMNKFPSWLNIPNGDGNLPVMLAASRCKKDALKLLISKHEENEESYIFEGQLGLQLLIYIISSEFLDVALELVVKHPNLATLIDKDGDSALSTIAITHSAFPVLETFSWWQSFIYHRIPLKKSKSEASSAVPDIENAREDGAVQDYPTWFHLIFAVGQKMLLFMIWAAIERLVPQVEKLRKKKAKHQQALQLAQFLCKKLLSSPETLLSTIFCKAALKAAECGITEIVEMIIQEHPQVIFYADSNGMNVFMLAASYRFENIINLIYDMSDRKYIIYDLVDKNENHLMHICGKLAPPARLNLVAGAALQMQRELQWFKEMEKYITAPRRVWPNSEDKTPQTIFREEHENLKAEGEKWMKDTANACTIAVALIATVMFAAAFTVPGGLESTTGFPLFTTEPAFTLFAVSDAISLFTSIFALLMFLSILTSRYAEEDFLYVLPKRLSIGLLNLFISITFMIVAFCATYYLVFRKDDSRYPLLLGVIACFPITSFALLQFPLLVDVIWSTYGPGIFGKKTIINSYSTYDHS